MKKPIIIICIIAVLVAIGFYMFFGTGHQPLVTGNIGDVAQITIVKDRTIEEESREKILPSTDAEILFNALKELPTTTVAHPNHIQSMQNDPLYIIKIYYNGTPVSDESYEIYTSETLLRFYRFIGTTGSSDDPGYILSDENERIKSLLEGYFQ